MAKKRTTKRPKGKTSRQGKKCANKVEMAPIAAQKSHPWRMCPPGEHWVRTHPMKVPPSKEHPEGYSTTRHCHCAKNPSGKDQLYPEEMQEIARRHFFRLKKGPCPLAMGFPDGNTFDPLITGWVRYWNEVFNPADPLTPNLVKALITSESIFKPDLLADKKDSNSARGLTQVTKGTRKILGDERGELKDHFLTVTKADLNSPTVNICAGVRWLFYKRKFLSRRLGRSVSWEEALAEYKGLNNPRVTKKRRKELLDRFLEKLGALEKCEK